MKELQLIDRVVVEIKDADVEDCTNEYVASVLRSVANEIENGMKGNNYVPDTGCEVLWEHECQQYGGFKILSNKSLISQYYYGSEPKPNIIDDGQHIIASVCMQDLEDYGVDVTDITEDDVESVATRMGRFYFDGCADTFGGDLREAAKYEGLKLKEEDEP